MVPTQRKNIDSFSYLYDAYAPALYGVILKLTPDVQLAGALLEKSFLKIWDELDGHDVIKGRLFSLMLRITLQECKAGLGFSKNILHHLPIKEEHSARLHEKMQRTFPDPGTMTSNQAS
jgi:DNA-directed RNA polymerase specialized sigma24 family protein